MATKTAVGKEGSYYAYPPKANLSYLVMILIVFLAWGIVPSFAELGGLAGDVTTFYVNWLALVAVAVIITVLGKWKLFGAYSLRDYLIMSLLGIAWPLIYSVAYFGSVVSAGSATTAVLNYTWPVFYILSAVVINPAGLRGRNSVFTIISIIFAVGAAATLLAFENGVSVEMVGLASLGVIAAVTQGFYSAATDRWRYDAWVMTLVVEAVTCIGVTIMVLLNGSLVLPSIKTLGYLAAIGAISNGIGFAVFLKGSQVSGEGGIAHKGTWLIGLCLVPFAQALIAITSGIEVKTSHWIAIGLILVSLATNAMANLIRKE